MHALKAQKALIEEMRAENRLTAESVGVTIGQLETRMYGHFDQIGSRLNALERLGRAHSDDVARIETKVAHIETKVAHIETDVAELKTHAARIEAKVDKLAPLEERVAALERRRA